MDPKNGNGNGTPVQGPNDNGWILKPRGEWIANRRAAAAAAGDHNFSQMHYARKGIITEEMEYVAKRESLAARTGPRRSGRAAA